MKIRYAVGRKLTEKTELDKWLTERYALFQNTETSMHEFEIYHIEWPIYNVDINEIEYKNYLNKLPDQKHYSTGVKLLTWDKKQLRNRAIGKGEYD